ncbi:MAG TPA: cytochrome P450, partial [Herpetosiphonaceae bacterium]|nr:cytochrome P450 [Herpetosiphonaceae bacterium]
PPESAFSALRSADPYPIYARLRERAPIQRTTLPDGRQGWSVMSYEGVQAVLKDPRFGKDARRLEAGGRFMRLLMERRPFRHITQGIIRLDPPDHTRLRALIVKAFTPRRVERLAPQIQAMADDLIDAGMRRGSMDLIADYATPLSVGVIAEMLGIPAADRPRLVGWSHTLLKLSGETVFGVDTSLKGLLGFARRLTVGGRGQPSALRTMFAFSAYLKRLIAARRASPGDDLVSALIEAKEQDDALNDDELLSMLLILFIAGHETTVHLIGNGTLALLLHPEQRQRLRDDPALIKSAVEEFLRYDGPVMSLPRYAMDDIDLKGHAIRKGDIVMVVLAAANHDPAYASCPHQLDITRSAGQHLAMGAGIHYCVGAGLGRLEGQIAIGALLRRLPNLALAVVPESLQWQTGRLQRGLLSLPVRF